MKRRRFVKKIACLALTSALLGSLAACREGGEQTNDTNNNNPGTNTEPTAIATISPAAEASPGTDATKPKTTGASAEEGMPLFKQNCAACHGQDGKGIPSLGKDLVNSQFVKSKKDEELVAFIIKGRDANDPENTTKIAMPPKGGNPTLTDGQITSIVAYMRTLK